VSFAYPGRPAARVLDDISLFFATGDLAFVVGGSGSGSGKSTVAQLLRMRAQTAGSILLDKRALPLGDEMWTRQQIACASQQCLLLARSMHDDVALSLVGPASLRRPQHATREEVIDVCPR
jgi:ATP-binding cassette subfamily B (MDR/TAP) protein 1